MSKAKTIDEKIRERALEDLKAEAEQASRAFLKQLSSGTYTIPKLDLLDAHGKQVSVREAIDAIERAIVEAKATTIQDKAVADFIKKVDSFQDQLDELQHSIN